MFTIATFILFTALVAILSWWYTRHDDQDSSTGYFLAGRSLSWFVVAGSLLLTNLSTEQLVGLNGGAFKNGMEIIAWELGAAVAMVVMANLCLPVYLRGGIATIPEFLARRYSPLTRSFISAMILIAVTVSVMPFVLYSGALFMVDLFELPTLLGISPPAALWLMVFSIGVVGGIYAIFGGLSAVAVSDTINGIGLFFGGLMIPCLGLRVLGDGSVWQGWQRITTEKVAHLRPLGDANSDLPWSTLLTGVALLHLYYWCTNQFILQRAFASRSLRQGQQGVLFAAFMKLLGPFYLVLPGVIAYHLYAEQIPADGNLAYSTLVRNVVPKPLLGFFAAVIFGAVLSTFNSALNSCATLFSVDLYKGVLRPQASDAEMVRAGKIFGTILALGTMVAAPVVCKDQGVFDAMKQLAATFDIPLMVVVFVGILSRRTPTAAVWGAVLTGVTFYLIVAFALQGNVFGHKIHWLHLAGINFALMMMVVIAIRWTWPRDTPYEHAYTEQVDITPWAWAKPASVAIVASVVVIFGYFAWLAM